MQALTAASGPQRRLVAPQEDQLRYAYNQAKTCFNFACTAAQAQPVPIDALNQLQQVLLQFGRNLSATRAPAVTIVPDALAMASHPLSQLHVGNPLVPKPTGRHAHGQARITKKGAPALTAALKTSVAEKRQLQTEKAELQAQVRRLELNATQQDARMTPP
jgi:hypothetical protein